MHAHETLVRRCLSAISTADADGWLACYTPDAVSRDVPLGSVWKGHAELAVGVRGWVTAIPDTRMEIRSLFADDRHGTCEWTMAGTLKGAMDGLPAPIVEAARGKSFTIQGVTVYEFSADGRISRESLYWDLARMLGQFGLLPPL
ncbi:nuclear transport factor 2 family protein [Streptomyces sp. NBC_00846]|uniref:ester cyclase n=1 Tax=Streptomyces sp. NBC_00846 TaxID=2975849 RepID=UPI00386F8BA4|nr:nuclear transport factor 2 family protein [Streptomyces sp. NBC_00846]